MQVENFSNPKDFSFRLRTAMERQRLRGEDLKKALGVASSTISGWRNGTYLPDHPMREPLAKELRVSYDWLYYGETKDISAESEAASIPKGTDFEGGITREEQINSRVVSMREEYIPQFGEKKKLLSQAELLAHVERYLGEAARHEGGLAVAQMKILRNLTHEDFEHLPEK